MPSAFQIRIGLAIVGYPTIASAIAVVAARFTRPASGARQAALAVAAAAGLLTAHVALAGVPKLPPVDSLGWVPVTTGLAALVGVTINLARGSERTRRWGIVVALGLSAALAAYLAGKPTFASHALRCVPLGAGAAATAAIALANTAAVARVGLPIGTWLALLVTAALSALCALWGSSASLAMLFGSMATTAGVIGVGSLILGIDEPAPAAQGVFIAHLTAIATYTHLYANLPALPMLLLAAAVAAPAASAWFPRSAPRHRWLRALLAIAVAAAFIGAAAVVMHGNVADAPEAAM